MVTPDPFTRPKGFAMRGQVVQAYKIDVAAMLSLEICAANEKVKKAVLQNAQDC